MKRGSGRTRSTRRRAAPGTAPFGWIRVPTGPIPLAARDELARRLQAHIARKWPGRVAKLLLKFHGAYAYVGMVEGKPKTGGPPPVERYVEEDEVPTSLCRLGYYPSGDEWAFAFFTYSGMKYEPSMTESGSFDATPEEAFDTCAQLHLQPFIDVAPHGRGKGGRKQRGRAH